MRTYVRAALYRKLNFASVVGRSTTLKQVLVHFGLRPAGGNFRVLRRWLSQWDISTEHFVGTPPPRSREPIPLERVLVERSPYPRSKLKQRLYADGLKQRACELCGQGEQWHGARMSLILDHINGVADDNRLENLRIVCPNCAATLDTHCGRAQPPDGRGPDLCPLRRDVPAGVRAPAVLLTGVRHALGAQRAADPGRAAGGAAAVRGTGCRGALRWGGPGPGASTA